MNKSLSAQSTIAWNPHFALMLFQTIFLKIERDVEDFTKVGRLFQEKLARNFKGSKVKGQRIQLSAQRRNDLTKNLKNMITNI